MEPPQITYKGTKFKYSVKGDIIKGIIVRTLKPSYSKSGIGVFLNSNDILSLKKKQNPKSLYSKGVVSKTALRRKKFLSLFTKVY